MNRPFGLPRRYYPLKRISIIEHLSAESRTERWLCIDIDAKSASQDRKTIVELNYKEKTLVTSTNIGYICK